MKTRAALLLALILPAPLCAGDITFWDGETLHTAPDPHAAIPARRTDPQTFGALAGADVGLVVEETSGAPVYVSNLIEGAVIRRFSGHVALQSALGAGQVLSFAPSLIVSGADIYVDWQVYDARRALLADFLTHARMSGATEAGRPFAAFTSEDAERIAFQVAAAFEEAVDIGELEARARLDRTPTPEARPQSMEEAAESRAETSPEMEASTEVETSAGSD